MGIKQFNDDAKAAIEAANRGELPNVSNLRKGESDGEIVFTYTYTYASTYTHTYTHAESPLEIQALSTEPEAYPRHSSFLIFTSSEEPVGLEKWLQEISDLANGKSVTDVIALISNRLTKKLEASSQLDGHISHEDSTTSDIDDDEESFYETEFDDMDIDPIPEREPSLHNEDPSTAVAAAAAITGRLKRHLREARSEGYHLWIPVEDREHGGLHKFSLSIHASKLKIPEEALEAWGLNPSDYVVMMFKLTSEYPLLSTFLEPSDRSIIQFSFGKCTSPNPSSISATRVFEGDDPESADEEIKSRDESSSPFLPLCMSLSFDTLLNKEFPKLLRLRLSEGISWDQAQELYAELSTGTHDTNAVKNHDESSDQFDLELLERNYLSKDADALNIILIAMQFSLQRLVNCPKYCLVCHRRTGNSFETIKPFVCESQLCLFQYLSLGFCQSIEHEIIHNSNVVDLLVSFFYAAIMSNRIREFPTGLGLKCAASAFAPSEIEPISVEVCFENKTIRCGSLDYPKYRSIAKGQFITLCPSSQTLPLTMPIMRGSCRKHICVIDSCKATDFTFEFISTHTAPNVQDDWTNPTSQAGSQTGYANPTWEKALVYKHEQDIDDLEVTERYQALNVMCECIPPVQEMKEYLTSHPGHQLSSWQRMDTSTVSLLNWIVASNRSFIVQDAPIPGLSQPGEEPFKHDNLVDGMADGWVQFRFVQGSPEKEQMFLRELIQRVNNGKPYPTLFAWHGSSLGNWHSIIRTGLDFSQTVNGRAYGNGVYFAKDFETSFSYSRHDGRLWRNSALEITSAITLCEIVNDTGRFVSASPYFVVNRVDWIQCRYLFIRVDTTPPSNNQTANATPQSIQPTVYVEQDPTHPLRCGLRSVSIPQSALSTSRRVLKHNTAEAVSSSQDYTTTVDESDHRAEINSYLDELLASDDEGDTQPTSGRKRRRTSVDSGLGEARLLATQNQFPWQSNNVTLFQPGQLDLDSLPKLAEPTWAASSPAALRALSSQIKDLQKIQSNTNLVTLGWYIDFERLDNLFHWIVELHSFDMDLALAQDMVRCGCSSIVIEVRFGASFPISPPFVRVIRPRFVPFAQGGGGHVTMGGSICSELLTNSGWSPALSLEKVFLEVRMNLCEKNPPARLERSDRAMNAQDYNVFEAIDAYRRAATAHGWQVPSDLEMLKSMMASER